MRITEHFDLSEFIVSQSGARAGLMNVPPDSMLDNLVRLAETMEDVRKLLNNKSIIISSGYRSEEVNRLVGGSSPSSHSDCRAVDFICPDFGGPHSICKVLERNMESLGIDQLICEFRSWVHLGIAPLEVEPRHMVLTIDGNGTRLGIA